MDWAVAALLDDLNQRGLLDEVVVVLASEMGRAPGLAEMPTAIIGPMPTPL